MAAVTYRPSLVRHKSYFNVEHNVFCADAMNMEAEFGWIEVNGVRYGKDIIIHADGTLTKREKKKSRDLKPMYGHTPLSERELIFLEDEKPDVFYVGTGHQGALPITPQAQQTLKKYETIILPTPEAIEKINQEHRKLAALIHVTC
jgi:hypothetical protein